ncbi:hypothetical protein CkaCkLH20_10762 [Colletotrichum karsti]|uniref:Uncharacterized protein n=1 Tax=Colletotrichum karsti TaxID=1095194 RepID=A0A9P6LFU3_9PEZI|nr:uncharacterized protein CkaCkLH20_10762 [Colletotrichum karsti]KAF9871828.1 hypothetical protein CkaCkLH20_10762 [Colletotrichum karsti]
MSSKQSSSSRPGTPTANMSSPSKNPLPPTSATSAANSNSTYPNNSSTNANTNDVAKSLPLPGSSIPDKPPVGSLLKGPVDANGNPKDSSFLVGIKLDLEAEVHLTARVRGDILVGLY